MSRIKYTRAQIAECLFSDLRPEQIKLFRDLKLSYRTIGDAFGVSGSHIRQILKRSES